MTTITADAKTAALEIIKKVSTIATLPEVTSRIISTVENPKSSASLLNKIVSNDPALVTRILKIVNSAFYGLPGQIGSIERAIVLLGLTAVKNIAVAASLGQLFRGARLSRDFAAKDIWTHSLAVGVAARDLAQQMKLPIADEAFLAGMIHDIGLLISLQISPEKLRFVCETADANPGADFCAMERKMIGHDHQLLGMTLAEHWRFPRSCQLVAGYHHNPSEITDSDRLLIGVVYIADTICCRSSHGFNLTAKSQTVEPAMIEELKISQAIIDSTTARLDQLVTAAGAFKG